MRLIRIRDRALLAFLYCISLIPVFLPWCYFDREMDGVKSGIDIINKTLLVCLFGVTFFCLMFLKNQKESKVTGMLLVLHYAVYLFYGLFWYVPLLTDFNLLLSLQALHYGFYLSVLFHSIVCWIYLKRDRKKQSV